VGNLRSTIIGDALARMYRFAGEHVIARNHVGDWGTPFGMLIEHLLDLGEDEAVASLSMGDLNGFYQAARVKFDADEAFRDRSRNRVVTLQSGDPETLRLWRILVDLSIVYFSQIYDELDVTLRPEDAVASPTTTTCSTTWWPTSTRRGCWSRATARSASFHRLHEPRQ